MAEQVTTNVEQEIIKLSAKLDEHRSSLAKEAEEARGKIREDLLAEVASVTARLDKLDHQLKDLEVERIDGLEVFDPKKDGAKEEGKKIMLSALCKIAAKIAVPQAPIAASEYAFEMSVLDELSMKKHGAKAMEVVKHASQNVGQDSAGGVFVPQVVADSIIPELTANMVSLQAGVPVMNGLQGNMSFPKKISGVTGMWLDTEAEESIVQETLTFGSISARPHPYAAATGITWLALQQPNIAIEGLVRQDFSVNLGLLWDLAILTGSGVSGQPKGIKNWAGIGTTSWSGTVFGSTLGSGGLATYDTSQDKLRAHHQDLRAANALGNGTGLAWIAEPDVLTKLESVQDTTGKKVYVETNEPSISRLMRAPVYSTTQINQGTSDGFLLYGKFAEAMLLNWGGLQFAMTDSHSTNFLTGVSVIRAIGACDVIVRQPTAFSLATSLTTT